MPRTLDEPITAAQVLTALGAILPASTNLGARNGTVSLNSRQPFVANKASYPGLVIFEGGQSTARISWRLWQTKITVDCEYYYAWQNVPKSTTIDQIWATIDTDLRRMKSNLMDNPRLINGGQRWALDVAVITMSPYEAEINDKDFAVPVIMRDMTVQINLPPFLSAA